MHKREVDLTNYRWQIASNVPLTNSFSPHGNMNLLDNASHIMSCQSRHKGFILLGQCKTILKFYKIGLLCR